jgi:hypothetical protein
MLMDYLLIKIPLKMASICWSKVEANFNYADILYDDIFSRFYCVNK